MTRPLRPRDLAGDIIRYEEGAMRDDEIVPFFQKLVDTGLAWSLQGSYGRAAHSLIEEGSVKDKPRPPMSTKRPIPQHRRQKGPPKRRAS